MVQGAGMVKLSEVLDAVYNAEENARRLAQLDRLRRENAEMSIEIIDLRGQLAVAEDKAQLYEGLYLDEMQRQAKETRR